jgi:hypothetical protein
LTDGSNRSFADVKDIVQAVERADDEVASSLSPLRPGHDHIGLPFAAAGTEEPHAPIEDADVGALPSSHLCRVRLDLMLARLAPQG